MKFLFLLVVGFSFPVQKTKTINILKAEAVLVPPFRNKNFLKTVKVYPFKRCSLKILFDSHNVHKHS